MAELTTPKRKSLPDSAFAFIKRRKDKTGTLIKTRKYPIHDEKHARSALSRGKQYLSSSDMANLKRKVKRRYPKMEVQGIRKTKGK